MAYLRTKVWSPKEQKAKLELGSDDGVKVWLNGQLVHANNAERPAVPGQDKADVTLKEGSNPMLVKLDAGVPASGPCACGFAVPTAAGSKA